MNPEEKMQLSRLQAHFSLNQFIHYAFVNLYYGGFISALYLYKGFTGGEVGIFSSMTMVAGLLGNLCMGYLCDRFGTNKKVYLGSVTITAIVVIILYFMNSFWAVMACAMSIFFLSAPMAVNLDTWIYTNLGKNSHRYGNIRLFGSMGASIYVVLYGQLISRIGWQVMPILSVILLAIVWLVNFSLRDIVAIPHLSGPQNREPISFRLLLKNKAYVLLVLTISGLMFTNFSYFNFLPMLIAKVGGTTADLGFINMFHCASEVPIFITYAFISRKIPARWLLLISVTTYMMRYILLMFVNTVPQLLMVAPLTGLSYSMFLPSIRACIRSLAPEHMRNSAQTVAESIYLSTTGIIAGFVGGYLIDKLGYNALLWSNCIICGLVMLTMVSLTIPMVSKAERKLELSL